MIDLDPLAELDPATEELLRFFSWEHLPDKLRKVSRPFAMLAADIMVYTPPSRERTAGLRKLLEAKDCIVRAAL